MCQNPRYDHLFLTTTSGFTLHSTTIGDLCVCVCVCAPQAYYDEATVCGNCMEICRKLDSIRNSGFPDGTCDIAGTFSRDTYLDPLRPSSEPLPDSIPATTSEKERPGTAAAGVNVSRAAADDAAKRLPTRSSSSPGGEQCDTDGVEGGEGGGSGSPRAAAASMESSRQSHSGAGAGAGGRDGVSLMVDPVTATAGGVDDGGGSVKKKHGASDRGGSGMFGESDGEPAVVQTARRGDKKATLLHTRREKVGCC